MLDGALSKLKGIYEKVINNHVEEEELLHGNLIDRFNIDSLIALQLIVEIEKCFDCVIEDDEEAIKLVDSPIMILTSYLKSEKNE